MSDLDDTKLHSESVDSGADVEHTTQGQPYDQAISQPSDVSNDSAGSEEDAADDDAEYKESSESQSDDNGSVEEHNEDERGNQDMENTGVQNEKAIGLQSDKYQTDNSDQPMKQIQNDRPDYIHEDENEEAEQHFAEQNQNQSKNEEAATEIIQQQQDREEENNGELETLDNSILSSNEAPVVSTEPSINDENLNHDLLQKQAKYIMGSNMLNLPQFKEISQQDKVTALVNMLNSNAETAMPSVELQHGVEEPVADTQILPVETKKPFRPDLNSGMTLEERERYSKYLHGENKITEMHDIPPKSRLFIGNLPLKNVSKEDLFRIFSPYGHILQINIKNAFGFIQYSNPQSVRTAIEKESQELNFGKKLILEISSSNARPQFDHGDHGTNSSSTFISSSKRPFQNEESEPVDIYSDHNQGFKKSKRYVPACVIYVKRTADRAYAYEVFNQFRRGTELETDMIFLKPRMELRRMINEVAHDGVWGVILVNKTRNVDIQTFYKGAQGETKFDEYISISADDAIAIFNNLKPSRGAAGHASITPMPSGNPYGHQQPPIPGPPPQQNYYGGYGMAGQMQAPAQPQQPPYVQQGYVMPMQAPGYGAPAPMAQQYGRYQNSPAPLVEPSPATSQINSLLGVGAGQMNQQQLLSAIQNLPPNVVSNLLSMAHGQQQQQQQQQSPQTQQQLLGLLQAMQGQQPVQQQQQQPQHSAAFSSMAQSAPSMNDNFASHHSSINSAPVQQPQQQQQQQQQPSTGSNVQSLLDSLAKLQK